jgi:hypothetical protein
MGLKSTLRRLAKALPIIVAAAPAVLDAAREVKKALKKPERQGE